MNTPPAVRLLPMSDYDEDVAGLETKDVQRQLFMRDIRRDGRYQFREQGLDAEPGTVVLFQLRSSVVASAVFERPEKYPAPIGEYTGVFHFKPETVRVFQPIGADQLRAIWPTSFKNFGRTKVNLEPAENYALFEQALAPLWITAKEGNSENDNYSPSGKDTRERIDQSIFARRGSAKFRNGLIGRYGPACLVTGSKLLHILEAAHICPYRGENDDHLTNGLLLRADIHTLFDLHLIGIRPDDLAVEIHPDLQEEYGQHVGHKLPCTDSVRPSFTALQEQYRQFQLRLGSP